MGGLSQVSSFSLDHVSSLKGKVFIVTGGNAGIGFSIVAGLISKGGTVVIASRNADRVNDAVNKIKVTYADSEVYGLVVDVSSFSSIDMFVVDFKKQFTRLDGLINNAGIFMTAPSKTEQGFEITLGTNVFGPAYLTTLLLPLLKENKDGVRIVFLSSFKANETNMKQYKQVVAEDIGGQKMHPKDTNMETYCLSKLLDSMYAFELQKRLNDSGFGKVEVYACDPGMIASNITAGMDDNKWMFKWAGQIVARYFADSCENGALSSIYCATAAVPKEQRGFTFSAGPKVSPYKWTCKAFTPENCAIAFDAINSTIDSKGFETFS